MPVPTPPDPGAEPGDTAEPGSGVIDWSVARTTADWAIARRRLPPGYDPDRLRADFEACVPDAEVVVAEATGLSPPTPSRARVADRREWVDSNIDSIQRLLGTTLRSFEEQRPAVGPMAGVTRTASGAQVGLLLSWLSTRVLGQYDLLLTKDGGPGEDLVSFVGPNVVAMEQRFGFAPKPFRMWLAIHEITHRCQFTGVPWLRDHFVSLVEEGIGPLAADPNHLAEGLRRALSELRAGRNPLEDAGLMGLVATPEQRAAYDRIQALMSLLEGHGDVTMDRGANGVPGAERFSRVLHERRLRVRGPAKLFRQALGIEAKLRQYAEGEKFVRAVEQEGGPELFSLVWQAPEFLPTSEEIRTPSLWVDRQRLHTNVA